MTPHCQPEAQGWRAVVAGAVLLLVATVTHAQSAALDRIKSRGYVTCGASQGVPGLSRPDEKGYYRGFDADICRSFAAAILGDREKARYVPLNAGQRFLALQTGEIDILPRTSTITYSRDMAVRFVQIYQYDGDAVLVRKKDNIKTAKDLNNKTVCLQGGGSLTENAILETEPRRAHLLPRGPHGRAQRCGHRTWR